MPPSIDSRNEAVTSSDSDALRRSGSLRVPRSGEEKNREVGLQFSTPHLMFERVVRIARKRALTSLSQERFAQRKKHHQERQRAADILAGNEVPRKNTLNPA